MVACIATWSFGLQSVKIAAGLLNDGGDCVDVVETAVSSVEDDPATGPFVVGRGSYPNSEGKVQLDAAIMRGRDCSIGAVCALEGYPKPIQVAKHIMMHCPHNILVGLGATQYASQNGFQMEPNDALLSPEAVQAYQEFKTKGSTAITTTEASHDTLSLLCLDQHGNMAAGVSTGGAAFKNPGRVGDSPLPGCGYYVDDKIGAAAATGDGEIIMRYCPSFLIVQLINQGFTPEEACKTAIRKMTDSHGKWFEIGVIALNNQGIYGAAGSVSSWKDYRTGVQYDGFPCAVWTSSMSAPQIITNPAE